MADTANSLVLSQTIVRSANIAGMTKEVEIAVQNTLFELGQETRDLARGLAPVKTGALRASIYVTRAGGYAATTTGRMGNRTSLGFRRSARAAVERNEKLSFITGNKHISERTQRARYAKTSYDYMRELKTTVTHEGEFAHLGSQGYQSFEDDVRSILPMGGVSRDTFFVTIGASAFYAGYVEYGTRRNRAQPFLTPAVNWARSQMTPRLTAAIGSAALSAAEIK